MSVEDILKLLFYNFNKLCGLLVYKKISETLFFIWVNLNSVDYVSNFTEISTSHNRICNFLLSLPLLLFPCTSSLFRYKGGRGNGKDSLWPFIIHSYLCYIELCSGLCSVCYVFCLYQTYVFMAFLLEKLAHWFFSHLSFSQVKLNLLNTETNGYCIGQLCFTELLT